ncbi:MAG: HEAT repeat domain-containing protein [Planctomycetota bacterium]|jgi:hypothetical protein
MPYPAQSAVLLIACMLMAACSAATEQSRDEVSTKPTDSVDRRQAPQRSEQAVETARALVASPAQSWSTNYRRFMGSSGQHSQALLAALQADPRGPGAQIALATLGTLGDPVAAPYLEERLRIGSTEESSESALALGRLPSPASKELLSEVIRDRQRDPLVRTASAAALLDLHDLEGSMPFLCAILLAGTPAGQGAQAEHGLPDRGRWAHERYMAIEAIRRNFAGETFGLDPDSSWPALSAAVAELIEHLREERGVHVLLSARPASNQQSR